MILYKYINKKINKTTKTQHIYKARHKMKIRYEKYAKKTKHLKYIIGSLSKLFISLSGDPNCSHFSELRYQKEKKNGGTQIKNDKAVGKQSQYPLLHEADTQSNSAWWLWRSTWMGCKAA